MEGGVEGLPGEGLHEQFSLAAPSPEAIGVRPRELQEDRVRSRFIPWPFNEGVRARLSRRGPA